ncbi:anaphase-promoting complex subunit Hcn1, partial [Chytriomyces hyalinus]
FDIAVEFATFRKNHPAISALEKPRLRDWQIYYLKTGFCLDLVSAIPFELLPVREQEFLWGLRLLRLYKLPRIFSTSPKFAAIRKSLESSLGIGKTFSGIFSLLFCLAIFLHLEACILFLAGRLNDFSNATIATVQYKDTFEKYIWALFTATGNTFPLYYKPNSIIEQMIVIGFLLVGAGLYASIVGMISAFSMGFDASGRLYKQKMDELREYFRWKDINELTQRKIFKYYEIKYRGKFFEEEMLFSDLNEPLRKEIALHNCKSIISKVNFLKRDVGDGRDDLFLGRIAMSLKTCYFVTGDIIISEGGVDSDMYFIMSGHVNVFVGGKNVTTLSEGSFFGGKSLEKLSSCMLYRLSKRNFADILTEYPDMKAKVEIIFSKTLAKLKIAVGGC